VVSSVRRYSEFVRALQRGGYQLTPQREAVLRVLARTSQHLSADQIYGRARQRCHTLSRATVYNTMTVLKQLGEVEELEFASLGHRYGAHSPGQHAHLVCTRCHRIEDYNDPDLDAAMAMAVRASGYRNAVYRLDLYGECPACQAPGTR